MVPTCTFIELAELKGFKTAKGARTDPYRAANWILRAALEGKILSYLLAPQYNSRKGTCMCNE